ncbi:MAG: ThuA domain-containing protein [Isosphaeraceae bacterium]|nr:ThuA domain-containing protein [Isosphaeraceae bacterium]
MRIPRTITWALALTCLMTAPALAQRKAPNGAKVLLLSGGQREHHGYREQALYLSQTLENTGRYQVTICEDAAILETPALPKYDILFVTADRRDPEFKFTPSQQQAIFDYVQAGHGYISIHGADNTPNDLTDAQTKQWKDLLGGIYSHKGQPDGKAIMGTYTIHIADKSHPVTQGLDDFELKDELYSNMQMKDDVKPLATIRYKEVDWPVAWTYQYGKGRIFHTSLGHKSWKPGTDDPLRNPNLTKLIVQGVDWVADQIRKSPSNVSQAR